MGDPSSQDLARNRRTVEAYDGYAAKYAAATQEPSVIGTEALRRFAEAVGADGRVLEVASGPGWDADDLEARGLRVTRTDLSEGFIALQRERGKTIERLDLVTGDLGGSWDGLTALYVLQHIERDQLDGVLARMAAAIRPGGHLLTSFQEGDGEAEQTGLEGGTYHVVQWRPEAMLARLAQAGFEVGWRHSFEGDEERWSILIARRP